MCPSTPTPSWAPLLDPYQSGPHGLSEARRLLAAVINMQSEQTAAGCTPTTTSCSSVTGFLSLPCLPPHPIPLLSPKGKIHRIGAWGLGLGIRTQMGFRFESSSGCHQLAV